MHKPIFVALTALAVAALACGPNFSLPNVGFTQITPGPKQTLTVSETLPDRLTVPDVSLEMGAGKLTLNGGAEDAFIEGTIEYNVAEWKPTITNSGDTLTIKQGSNFSGTVNMASGQVTNDWTLKLADETPLSLTVKAGAYNGKLDLGGLSLLRLEVNDGASDTTVDFSQPNPVEMSELVYKTGASDVELTNLANANAGTIIFEGGAGSYTLDFSGTLQRDALVSVKAGLGTLKIIVPSTTAATIIVTSGLGSVRQTGTWTVNNNLYSTATTTGPKLTINIDIGAGSLELVSK